MKCTRPECKEEIVKGKYCSKSCSAKHNGERGVKNSKPRVDLVMKFPQVATRLCVNNKGNFINGGRLFSPPCDFCGNLTGLKTNAEIERRRKVAGGIFCKASCKRGEVIPSTCEICGEPIKHKCKKNGKYARFCSKICYASWQMSDENRKENSPTWKGGYINRDRKIREYKEWRSGVFTRDNFTCQRCSKVGAKLVAHHIRCWSEYIDHRFLIDNGVTLCDPCHKIVNSSSNLIKEYIIGLIPNLTNTLKR